MKHILLVEDDSHLQFLITEELKDAGYDVAAASNGKEALSLLFDGNRNEPDLIIMDIRMPKMDGIDALATFSSQSSISPSSFIQPMQATATTLLSGPPMPTC